MKRKKTIPTPSDALTAMCDATNQFANFDRLFRSVASVPKQEVLKEEVKAAKRSARVRKKTR